MMISDNIVDVIVDNRLVSSHKYQLTDELLQVCYDEKWFKIWVPKSFGGLGLDFVQGCKLLEEIAYLDGSFGWTVTLCSGATMFVGYIDEKVAKEVFSSSTVCLGGSGKIGENVKLVDGGFRVSGTWPYATGAPHLSHFTLNITFKDLDGKAQTKSLFVRKEDVLIHYDWETFGLESTASHSFSLNDVFVPNEQSFEIDHTNPKIDNSLYNIPFVPFAELTLFVNYLGMYRRFCDLSHKIFMQKSSNPDWKAEYHDRVFHMHDVAVEDVDKFANEAYRFIDALKDNPGQSSDVLQQTARCTREGVQRMKRHLMEIFPLCGISAAQKNAEINGVFRNFFTATQHSLLNSKIF